MEIVHHLSLCGENRKSGWRPWRNCWTLLGRIGTDSSRKSVKRKKRRKPPALSSVHRQMLKPCPINGKVNASDNHQITITLNKKTIIFNCPIVYTYDNLYIQTYAILSLSQMSSKGRVIKYPLKVWPHLPWHFLAPKREQKNNWLLCFKRPRSKFVQLWSSLNSFYRTTGTPDQG